MAEAGSAPGFFDARHYTYLPPWAKAAVLAAATLLLLLAAVMIYRSLGRNDAGDNILFYLSLAQTGALALIFAIILLFSTRDGNVHMLHRLGDQFLSNYVAQALRKVSVPALGIDGFTVRDLGRKDIYGRVLEMQSPKLTLRLWVGHNVRCLSVLYFVPLTETQDIDRLQRDLAHTFEGAEGAGYAVGFEPAMDFVSIWTKASTSAEFLYNPREKLFWAQDIAMMTQSFLRSVTRHGIALDGAPEPGPL